jgi:pilus assembly protein CpaB
MGLKLPSLRINRTWMMLLAAIGLALLATFLTTRYLASREASIAAEVTARTQKGGPRVAVAVPVRDMQVGMVLAENSVAAREVAADLIYANTILADDFEKYKGQALIRSVLKGRPLLKTDLKPEVADFSGTLADGIRAITVDIDELNAVAHMVQPGNRVDLMLAMQREEGGQTVVPFMDRMKVLATGQRVVQESEEKTPGAKKTSTYSTLTLEVTPSQAARLTLAQNIGKLRYVLRNEKDEGSVDFAVNAQNIFDEISQRTRNAKKATTLAGVVEYIIGGQRSGPSLKSVDVPVPGAAGYSAGTGVPPLVPAIEPQSPGAAAAAAGAAAASAAVTAATRATPPAAPPAAAAPTAGSDASGLTPAMKAELKTLIEK